MYVLNVISSLLISSKIEMPIRILLFFNTMYDDEYTPIVYTDICFSWGKFFELYVC